MTFDDFSLAPALARAADLPKPVIDGLTNPESVVVAPAPDGRTFVSVIGEFEKDGDGSIAVVADGKATTLVGGLDDPKGIAIFEKWLYVADKTKLLRIDITAKEPKAEVYVAADRFPVKPQFLNDVAVDPESGTVFVSDSGDRKGAGGQVFPGPWGESVSRNLTPHETGLKNWTDAEIAKVIREGVGKDGSPRKPPMAFGWYKNINDADMKALIAYLRSMKPVAFAGKS